ncbi:MAG: phage tail protein [Deltaproteobacteria bacterium]|nr:phage tail protein [Deltaproteobacteria bacterium]
MEGYMGQIMAWGPNFAPRGWALCYGSLLSVSQNPSLFSLLGTRFGGDGRSTFGLPDLRGRAPVGVGDGPGLSSYQLGQKGGIEATTLTVNQMPSHNHTATATMKCMPTLGDSNNPAGKVLAKAQLGSDPVNIYKSGSGAAPMGDNSVSVIVADSGGGQPVGIMQPYQAVNYIICIQGLYPPRD